MPPDPLPDPMVGKKLGRYEIVRVLGRGAMGMVYEARDPNLDRRVAIKTIKVENLSEEAALEYEARFRTEARSAARLQHPNIVSVYDSGRDGDIAFLVMEFIQGDDLKHHLDSGRRFSLAQVLSMVGDLLSALDYAHRQNIVHRDVKPANLLIEADGRVKLTDFGVARIQDSGDATRTRGVMVGTLKHMSPEQVQGQPVDARADLFAAAIVLYQLLTGVRPFDGDNEFAVIQQIVGHNPVAPSALNALLPVAIDAVLARALAKQREQRFATGQDFAVALREAGARAADPGLVPPPSQGGEGPVPGSGRDLRDAVSTAQRSGAADDTGSTVTQELELVYWKEIKDSGDAQDIEIFLAKFPAGIYADLARRRLKRFGDSAGRYPGAADETQMDTAPGPATVGFAHHIPASPSAPPAAAPQPPGLPVATEQAGALEQIGQPELVTTSRLSARRRSVAQPLRQSTWPVLALAGLGALATLTVVSLAFKVVSGLVAAPEVATRPVESAVPAIVQEARPVPLEPAVVLTPDQTASAARSAVIAPATRASSASAARPLPRAGVRAAADNARSTDPVATKAADDPSATAPAAPKRAPIRPSMAPAEVAASVAAPPHPAQACEGRVLLGYQICVNEQCAKPAFTNHPVCVERRAMDKARLDAQEANKR